MTATTLFTPPPTLFFASKAGWNKAKRERVFEGFSGLYFGHLFSCSPLLVKNARNTAARKIVGGNPIHPNCPHNTTAATITSPTTTITSPTTIITPPTTLPAAIATKSTSLAFQFLNASGFAPSITLGFDWRVKGVPEHELREVLPISVYASANLEFPS